MNDIFGISILPIIKIAALILLSLYIVFALVIVKQVKIMTDTLHLGFEAPIRFFSFIHLLFSAFVFITALVTL